MSNRKTALNRVRSSKQKKDKKDRIKRWDYVTHDNGEIVAVYCKLCGGKTKDLIPVDRVETKKVIKGQTIIWQRVVLQSLPGFAEIEIVFDDGSAHITNTCSGCIRTGLDQDDLELLYAADMEQFAKEESLGLGDVIWEHWADRIPLSYKVVE
tara:strand:- start:153 stop:611 length:459 start_codon:yes stop_codon:yes gene_type:complete